MSIPLVQENTKDAINTSIIAIKRNIERINNLLGLSGSEEINTSIFATKEELDALETALQPVNEVTSGNMQSVTSGAVASALENYCTKNMGIFSAYFTPQQVNDPSWLANYVHTVFDEWGIPFILFSVGWEDYQVYPHAGCQGYFMKGVSSARCFGQMKEYSTYTFNYSCIGIDNFQQLSWVTI